MIKARYDWDLVIFGSGFAGCLMAMIARKRGYRTLILERHQHPRITLGESTTPLTNLLLEELAVTYELDFLHSLTRWGRWKKTHPAMKVGLKRGFTFYSHSNPPETEPSSSWQKELMVAASPRDDLADTHWWREDLDVFLLEKAIAHGAHYWDQSRPMMWEEHPNHIQLHVHQRDEVHRISTHLVIDASGGASAVAALAEIPTKPLKRTPQTFSAYSHFEGMTPNLRSSAFPYPPHQAAVHQLIPGGWIWTLHFDHQVASAGVVFSEQQHPSLKSKQPEIIWQEAMKLAGNAASSWSQAQPLYPLKKLERVSFIHQRIHGSRWIMLPSAAGFVDPLLSTGFPMTLLGIQRIAQGLPKAEALAQGELPSSWEQAAKWNQREMHLADELIGTLYTCMDCFECFATTTLIYFASVSYAETVRRLSKPHLAPGFLFSEDASRSDAMLELLVTIRQHKAMNAPRAQKWESIRKAVFAFMEPINVIGLDPWKEPAHFPASMDPLFENAFKCESSPQAIRSMLLREGMLACEDG